MINPIPTWREGRLVLVRLKDSSVIVSVISDIKTGKNEIIFKPRYQSEVFSTSNYNGYVTVSGVIVESKLHRLDTNYICFL